MRLFNRAHTLIKSTTGKQRASHKYTRREDHGLFYRYFYKDVKGHEKHYDQAKQRGQTGHLFEYRKRRAKNKIQRGGAQSDILNDLASRGAQPPNTTAQRQGEMLRPEAGKEGFRAAARTNSADMFTLLHQL